MIVNCANRLFRTLFCGPTACNYGQWIRYCSTGSHLYSVAEYSKQPFINNLRPGLETDRMKLILRTRPFKITKCRPWNFTMYVQSLIIKYGLQSFSAKRGSARIYLQIFALSKRCTLKFKEKGKWFDICTVVHYKVCKRANTSNICNTNTLNQLKNVMERNVWPNKRHETQFKNRKNEK